MRDVASSTVPLGKTSMNKPTLLFVIALAGCSRIAGPSLPADLHADATAPNPLATSGYVQLYRFGPPPDGNTPTTDVVFFSGLLYGTTYGGGKTYNRVCARGCGTVYSINPYNPSGSYVRVYSFQGGADGAIPEGGLNPNGNGSGTSDEKLYGTTFSGGQKGSDCYIERGCGTAFAIDAPGKETILHKFLGSPDGSNPSGGRRYVSGLQLFYGTTQYGGEHNFGTVYSVDVSGHETVIYSFKGGPNDGAYPVGDVATQNCTSSTCTLYGVTQGGGASNVGTIFEITIPGTERRLYSFVSSDGDAPVGVEFSPDHTNLYGAASRDGANNRGSIFAFSLAKKSFSIVHSFTGTVKGHDGSLPYAKPTFYKDPVYGNALYGTTQGGGSTGNGTIYRITLSDNNECIIHSFGVSKSDGLRPDAPLRDFSGLATGLGNAMYGTTAEGPPISNYNKGYGTVFQISPEAPPEGPCSSPSPSPATHRAR